MAVGVHVADNAVQPGIVRRNRTIQIDPEGFSNVGNIVLSIDFLLCRQSLSFDGQAKIPELIVTLIAYGEVELISRTDFQPAAVVVVTGRQPRDDVHRIGQGSGRRIVVESRYLAIQITVR